MLLLCFHVRLFATPWTVAHCTVGCTVGSSVRGIFQARMLEWVAISYSMGSSGSRNRTCISCNAGRFFTAEPLGKPLSYLKEEKRVLCNQARPSRKACILERIKVIVSAIVASWICLQAWPTYPLICLSAWLFRKSSMLKKKKKKETKKVKHVSVSCHQNRK